MSIRRNLVYFSILAAMVSGMGCARAARDTTGFAMQDSAIVEAPFEEAWQTTKAVLREMELDVHTRDKRGRFVAYSGMTRRRLFVPNRVQYTVVLEPASPDTTKVVIETMKQVYGVTLLTYPDWHDRKTQDNSTALEIIERLEASTS